MFIAEMPYLHPDHLGLGEHIEIQKYTEYIEKDAAYKGVHNVVGLLSEFFYAL